MKRTPLNRGKSELKRTPMKKRRTRHKDTSESLAIRIQYRADNPECEVSKFLASVRGVMAFREQNCEIHHLVGASGRTDVKSNLITVSSDTHRWIEENPVDGRIVCCLIKHAKGELDVASYDRLFGQSVVAWLERHEPNDVRLLPSWEALISALDNIKD